MTSGQSGVTAPLGFRAAGVAAGLKSDGALDVAMVVNDGPLPIGVAVTTNNRVQAAPVVWTREVAADGQLRAVLLNSGGANACTGPAGLVDTATSARHVARLLDVDPSLVAVCSTGLIGERLPMDRLMLGCEHATKALHTSGGADAADAILTTDTRRKQSVRSAHGITVGGMAKGAGMLAPSLATMLAVVTTDAVVDVATADRVLRKAVSETFDRIDSDGCMSTNDTVLFLASGAAARAVDEAHLQSLVHEACFDLSQQLLGDAEGASKDIRIDVTSAGSGADALEVGRAIARSSLFKCAVHGEDANWGRVLAAVGTTSATFDPARLAVAINGVWVCRDGSTGEDRMLVDLSGRVVIVTVDLAAGATEASVWTNDLTPAYVHENSAYSS